MKNWFLGLDAKERKIVLVIAALVTLLFLYGFIWKPLVSDYRSLKSGVAQQQETLSWMRGAAQKIQQLKRSSAGANGGLRGRSLLAVVDQLARSGGLGDSIKRIEPDGKKAVKVWMDGVAFDPMMTWLGQLSNSYQVQPKAISIEQADRGRVNVRITLLEPSA